MRIERVGEVPGQVHHGLRGARASPSPQGAVLTPGECCKPPTFPCLCVTQQIPSSFSLLGAHINSGAFDQQSQVTLTPVSHEFPEGTMEPRWAWEGSGWREWKMLRACTSWGRVTRAGFQRPGKWPSAPLSLDGNKPHVAFKATGREELGTVKGRLQGSSALGQGWCRATWGAWEDRPCQGRHLNPGETGRKRLFLRPDSIQLRFI
jgi:hypothetical protein